MKMAENSQKGQKTLWEKEKLLITGSVFKGLVLQTRENQGLFGKGLQTKITILATFILSSANAFSLVQSKIYLLGNELTLSQTSPCFYVSAV